MYYLQSRYYNLEWGRFINADALDGSVGSLLSHNVFAYCKNNPINMIDENGFLAMWLDEGGHYGYGAVAEGSVYNDTHSYSPKLYESAINAAKGYGRNYNGSSIDSNKEYVSAIYKVNKGNKSYYTYTMPSIGNENTSSITISTLKGVSAIIHTHAAFVPGYDSENFSPDDKQVSINNNLIPIFVCTPSGRLKMYTPSGIFRVKTISKDMPYDNFYREKRSVFDRLV